MSDVSTAPWDGSASRFSDDEWKRSAILDRGEGATPKQRYALPVREPSGALNRHGLAAAAAVLSGGRGGVNAPDSAKAAARSKLNGLYRQAGLTVSTSKADDRLEVTSPVWKDDAKQNLYGVVMTPWVEDSQGDTATPEVIEKAAHDFMVNSRKNDVQHNEQQADVQVIESYIAPYDMDIGGQQVLKGAWVMGLHIPDRELWQRTQKADGEPGALTGLSVGGWAWRS